MIPSKRGGAPGGGSGGGQQGGGEGQREGEDKPRGGQGGQGQQLPNVEPNKEKEEGDMEEGEGGGDKLT